MNKSVKNIIFENIRSGLRANHSSKSSPVKVSDGLRLSVDFECVTVLILLDLSNIFDTIHDTLIDCLKLWVVSSVGLN